MLHYLTGWLFGIVNVGLCRFLLVICRNYIVIFTVTKNKIVTFA